MSPVDRPRENEGRTPGPVGSALAVLRCFDTAHPWLGVTEIAAMVGLHKSSVSRLLATLEQEELVEQDPLTKRYRLGLGLIAIAAPLLAELDVRRASLPVLQELAERVRETAALVLWNGHESVVIEQVAAPRAIKHTSPLGTTYRTAASASVRVFLAALPREEALALLAGGGPQLGTTHDSPQDVLDRLDREAGRTPAGDGTGADLAGVSVNDGDSYPDEVGIAAPVRDHRGEVVAAVLVSAPRYRTDAAAIAVLARECREAAREITGRLGAGGH